MKYLRLELFKMKHRKVYLTFFFILGVELLFIFSNYGRNSHFQSMVPDPSAPAWENLIVGPAAMNGLFFPILSAVLASRICDIEHRGNTWKLLECNNQSRNSIWLCKFTIVAVFMLAAIFSISSSVGEMPSSERETGIPMLWKKSSVASIPASAISSSEPSTVTFMTFLA